MHKLIHYYFSENICLVFHVKFLISYYFRIKKSTEIVLTRSSRGSHILKTLVKQKADSMDTNKNQMSESEEVISPEVRVGPAEKEKHSVSMKNVVKYFFPIGIGRRFIFLYIFSGLYSYQACKFAELCLHRE
jgi:methyltransferase-like protein